MLYVPQSQYRYVEAVCRWILFFLVIFSINKWFAGIAPLCGEHISIKRIHFHHFDGHIHHTGAARLNDRWENCVRINLNLNSDSQWILRDRNEHVLRVICAMQWSSSTLLSHFCMWRWMWVCRVRGEGNTWLFINWFFVEFFFMKMLNCTRYTRRKWNQSRRNGFAITSLHGDLLQWNSVYSYSNASKNEFTISFEICNFLSELQREKLESSTRRI